MPRARRQGNSVRLHFDPFVQQGRADGRQADSRQGNGPGDRSGVLSRRSGSIRTSRARIGCRRRTRLRSIPTWEMGFSRPGASTSCTASSARLLATRALRYGETILTVWPPPANFAGINAVTRVIHVDANGDGRGDRTVTVPMPIFHVLGLLADMGGAVLDVAGAETRRTQGQRLCIARRSRCGPDPCLFTSTRGYTIAVGRLVRR